MKFNYEGNANKPVIYMIYNFYSHGVYIGQGSECKRRWNRGYAQTLPKGRCHNSHLQNAYNKAKKILGHDDFIQFYVLKVMEGSTQEERNIEEAKFIKFYKELEFKVYNKLDRNLSPQCSIETCEKISKKVKEFYDSEEGDRAKEKLSKNRIGKTYEEFYGEEQAKEIKDKLSDIGTGEGNIFFGKTHTQEAKDAINKNRIGKTYEEVYGIEKANEIKQKQSITASKQTLSDDHKEKLRQSRIKTYDNIRLLSPDGQLYTTITNLSQFCRECNVSVSKIHKVLTGKRNKYKGWTIDSNFI